jgi:hypothetical protein
MVHTLKLATPHRIFAKDFAGVPWRVVIDVWALVFAIAILAWRIHEIQQRNKIEFTERTAHFAVVKGYYDRVMAYSEAYGRPIFMWTGVHHASPAESTLYERLRLDLRDPRIRYWYTDTWFNIAWYDPSQGRRFDPSQIAIRGEWPPDARWYAYMRWYVNHPSPRRHTTWVK